MQYDRLTSGLAAVLGGITVVLTALALATNPAILFLALMFGLATAFVYYHASGRMASRLYRRVERQARVDARRHAGNGGRRGAKGVRNGRNGGPREEWEPPRGGATAREAAAGQRQASRQRGQATRRERQRGRQTGRVPSASNGLSATEARKRLGVDSGADQAAIKAAYREKVKAVHPDTDGGDEAAFKQINEAYDRLSE